MFIRGRQLIEWLRKELAFEPVQRTSSKRLLKLQGALKRCDYNLISQDDCVTASLCVHASDQGPVVLRLISANPRLNYNPGFFIPMFKSLFGIFSSVFYGASNHRLIDKKNYAEFSFKTFRCEIRFDINPGLS